MKRFQMPAIVLSGFPCVGKSYCFNTLQDHYEILDSDSSNFSWLLKENGSPILTEDGKKIRNPDFPNNYIKHIKDNLNKVDIIFVSSHDVVRNALKEAGINYYLVFPYNTPENRDEWLTRMIDRGSPLEMCKFISENWDNFIADMEIEDFPVHIQLGQDYEGLIHEWYITKKLLDDLIVLSTGEGKA